MSEYIYFKSESVELDLIYFKSKSSSWTCKSKSVVGLDIFQDFKSSGWTCIFQVSQLN